MPAMHAATLLQPGSPGFRLAGIYLKTFAVYLLGMYALWAVGFETIYAHPTPFYALFAPAMALPVAAALAALLLLGGRDALVPPRPGDRGRHIVLALPIFLVAVAAAVLGPAAEGLAPGEAALRLLKQLAWQIPALGVFGVGAWRLIGHVMPRLASPAPLQPAETRRILIGLFAFSIAFACGIAMIRGGLYGIEQAYARSAYEYTGDIGKTRSIQALFAQYLEIHEHLSMHAKVHPPGPIALLWLFSMFLLTSSPLPLSLATVVFSSLAIFPLYGWTKRVTDGRTALVACLCYCLIPSVVLFTATSADALFTPFTLGTLYCFERAIRTRSARFALLAGAGYGAMMLLKFSLIGVGAYFGLVGLWLMRRPETRWNVAQTAALMIAAVGAVLGAVYWWSGYDIYANFLVAKAQFDLDQKHLDELAPRLAAWTYRFWNPACWFYFGGIPLALLFLWELFRGGAERRAPWIVFALALFALNLLYIARGEGERSALYMIPFILMPAASQLVRLNDKSGDQGPLLLTLAFLAYQTWFTETFFYTYW